MAIDSLGSNSSVAYSQLSASTQAAARPSGDSDGGAARVPGGGKFADAVAQALAQVTGGSATSATNGTSGIAASTDASGGTQDPKQAEAAFAQSLFTALQSQFGGKQDGASGAGEGSHHHHHGGGGAGGGGKIAGALQNLAQQLSSGSGDSSSPAASSLQTNFNNLLAANGQSGSSASLPQFLQTLAQNLQGASSAGNVVSTKV